MVMFVKTNPFGSRGNTTVEGRWTQKSVKCLGKGRKSVAAKREKVENH